MLMLIIPLFVQFSFFFLPIKIFVTDFSAPMTARLFLFCKYLERVEVYRVKENQYAKFILPFFSIFSSLTPI